MMKDRIMQVIENEPTIKRIYEENGECFNKVILPDIEKCGEDDDKAFEQIIFMLISLSAMYDKLLSNIAKSENADLILKCDEDIHNLLSTEE